MSNKRNSLPNWIGKSNKKIRKLSFSRISQIVKGSNHMLNNFQTERKNGDSALKTIDNE